MCTCTCMWKGTFQEEVCLPFFIKKKKCIFYLSTFLYNVAYDVHFHPPVSLSLFSRSRGTLCSIQYPTPCCYFHILLFCLFSVWAFGIYWSTVGFTPEGKDSSCPRCCWLPIAPQGRAGLFPPLPVIDRPILYRSYAISSWVQWTGRVQNTAFCNPASILGSNVRLYLDLLCAVSFAVFSSLSQ